MSDWPAGVDSESAWTHLDTQVLTGAAGTVTFSGLSTNYRRWRVLAALLQESGANSLVGLRLNNDSGGNYFVVRTIMNGVAFNASSTGGLTYAYFFINLITSQPGFGYAEINRQEVSVNGGAMIVGGQVGNSSGITSERHSAEWDDGGASGLVSRIDLVVISGGNLDVGSRIVLEAA